MVLGGALAGPGVVQRGNLVDVGETLDGLVGTWSDDSQTAFWADDPNFIQAFKLDWSTGAWSMASPYCWLFNDGGYGSGPPIPESIRHLRAETALPIFLKTASGFIYTSRYDHPNTPYGITSTDDHCRSWTRNDLYFGKLSPDRTQLIAIKDPTGQLYPGQNASLTKVNVLTGDAPAIKQPTGLDQAGWSADGKTIFYSTRVDPQRLRGANQAFIDNYYTGSLPDDFVWYTLQLWRMPAQGGPSTLLLSEPGFSIDRIAGSPDGQHVVFSEIPSMGALINALDTGGDLALADPFTVIYSLPITGGYPQFIAIGAQLAVGSGKFTAMTSSDNDSDH